MKHFISLLFIFCAGVTAFAQSLPPQFFDNSNAGTEYYLTFLPAWPIAGGNNDIRIHVYSPVETQVTVEVTADGFSRTKTVKPNTVTEFNLPVMVAQPYYKTDQYPSPKETIYRKKAVHIVAKDPVIVYGATRYEASSDAFLGIPVSGLGTEYIIASFADMSDNSTGVGPYMPSEAGIVAAFDNTQVHFTLGGNPVTRTSGGMKPGDTKTFVLDRGDVLPFASFGKGGDLSGSKVVASRPVAVISGSYCSYIPDEFTSPCDHLLEMELPAYTWGKEYAVTKIFGRQQNPWIKVMAREPDTKIFRNGQHIATIRDAGGVEGFGYISRRTWDGLPANFVISADKPISVTQFNPGEDDDDVPSEPFQLALTPADHFMKDVVFTSPGIGDGKGFTHNYVNLVFALDNDGGMPDDLEMAVVENNEFHWIRVSEKFGAFFEKLLVNINGRQYGVRTIKLPGDGIYRFRAFYPLAAYCYGFSPLEAYAYPAGASLADLGGEDTLPPVPVFTQNSSGNVRNGVVTDTGSVWNSNLARITLLTASSFNYTMETGELIPGQSDETMWELTVNDQDKPARAEVMFVDRAGNDTTITVEFHGTTVVNIAAEDYDFGQVTVGTGREGTIRITSPGSQEVTVTAVEAPASESFTADLPAVPFTLSPGTYREIPVHFNPHAVGVANEEILFYMNTGIGVAKMTGTGIEPILVISSVNFSDVEVGFSDSKVVEIRNTGTEAVPVTTLRGPTGPVFTIPDMPALPLVIEAGEAYNLTVHFEPPDTAIYSSEIFVGVYDFEVSGTVFGRGVKTPSVGVYEEAAPFLTLGEVYPNPANAEAGVNYMLARTEHIRLVVLNAMGREVLLLADGVQTAGKYTVPIPAGSLPPGMYVCHLTSGGTTVSGRFVVVR